MPEIDASPTFFARKSFLGLPNYIALMLAVTFVVGLVPGGTYRAIKSNSNEIKDWLPSSYEESADLSWFQRHFLGEQFILVSWDGCTLGNTDRLQLLTAKLRRESGDEAEDVSSLFGKVTSGPSVLDQLTSPPLSLEYHDAIERLEGSLVGPLPAGSQDDDDRATCLIVTLSKQGQVNNIQKRRAIDAIKQIAADECSIKENELHLGGPPVDNVTIDIEGQNTLKKLAKWSGLVGIVLSYICFRSFRITFMVFAVGVLSAGLSLTIVRYYGVFEKFVLGYNQPRFGTVDAILMSMPPVVYVLGISGAIHIVNYYRDARQDSGLKGAAESAVRTGWVPCTLAALTTAVGLGSLVISDITPIKKFGGYTAAGVIATLFLLFTLLPVCLFRFPEKWKPKPGKATDKSAGHGGHMPEFLGLLAGKIGRFIVDRNGWVSAACILVMIGFAVGLTQIETRIQLLKMFDADARIIHDYDWLETNLGNLVPMEVVLRYEPSHCRAGSEDAEAEGDHYRLNMFERMKLVELIQQRIESLEHVGRALSPATFGPDLDVKKSGVSGALVDPRYVVNLQLEKHRDDLLQEDYLREEQPAKGSENAPASRADEPPKAELWRISARVCALQDVDYGEFVRDIRAVVEPVLAVYRQRDDIIAKLHANEKRLRLGRVCVLYEDAAAAQADAEKKVFSSRDLLAGLLRSGGAKLTSLNLAKIPSDESADRVVGQVQKALAKQDCVVVLGTPNFDVTPLVENAPLRLDLASINEVAVETDTPQEDKIVAAGIKPVYTGVVPLVYKTQRELLVSLQESVLTACVLIAVVMMVLLRSFRAGLVSMLPNIFPIVVVFGAMGWLRLKIDIGIMMSASVALGVAVDDTVHFLTWFRDGLDRGLDRKEATMMAYRRCATAMFQTTIIAGLGLAVFALSTFTPTQQFGVMMVMLLSAALIGDLVFLPAILSGPGGLFFRARAKQAAHEPAAAEPVARPTTPSAPAQLPHLRRDARHRLGGR